MRRRGSSLGGGGRATRKCGDERRDGDRSHSAGKTRKANKPTRKSIADWLADDARATDGSARRPPPSTPKTTLTVQLRSPYPVDTTNPRRLRVARSTISQY